MGRVLGRGRGQGRRGEKRRKRGWEKRRRDGLNMTMITLMQTYSMTRAVHTYFLSAEK